MIVAKNCYFWSVFAQISGGGYPPNSSKFPQPQFLLTCTYFGGRRHGRSLPLAKATDGLAFGITRHCRIEGLPPMPPTPAIWRSIGIGAAQRISEAKMLELCATTLQWRWLFIDEISMVSAELLARLELRCREVVRDLSKHKYGRDGLEPCCFGGLNVCFSGDLWQLPPPRGTFIGEVPWEMITKAGNKKLALTIRGQELIWGVGGHGIHGVTELVQCERTRDEWLQELQDQLRHGRLSDENHALLHGRMTQTPGSTCKGKVMCQQPECNASCAGTKKSQRER